MGNVDAQRRKVVRVAMDVQQVRAGADVPEVERVIRAQRRVQQMRDCGERGAGGRGESRCVGQCGRAGHEDPEVRALGERKEEGEEGWEEREMHVEGERSVRRGWRGV